VCLSYIKKCKQMIQRMISWNIFHIRTNKVCNFTQSCHSVIHPRQTHVYNSHHKCFIILLGDIYYCEVTCSILTKYIPPVTYPRGISVQICEFTFCCALTHTHTHTHTRTRACTHARMHARARARTRTHTHRQTDRGMWVLHKSASRVLPIWP